MNPGEVIESLGASPNETTALVDRTAADTRELWRVVSTDGSTRIFQTKPSPETRGGKRPSMRRVTPCALDGNDVLPASFFECRGSPLPPVVTENESASSGSEGTALSAELTSVTQAWPSLSPGIRGAIMALIRAATIVRPPRPAAAPRRE